MDDKKQIKDILSNIFSDKSKLSKGYNQYHVEDTWRKTFGEMISKYTSGVRFYNGTLEVYITSASLKQELEMSKESVMNKLNAALSHKKVSKLVIR